MTLLAGVSAHAPLLCLIDDAQWLDGETKELLAFIARRLYAEGLVLLLAVREPTEDRDAFAGLPELRIRGLQPSGARRLLSTALDQRLDMATTSRLVHETQGNPLALVELGRDATTSRRAAALLPVEPLPLSRRLEDLFKRQVQELPEETQQFLLVAAAEPAHTDVVWKAAEQLRIPAEVADPAIDAGLFDPQGVPAFRHPLIRSAVYGAASASDRRRVHAAIADVLDVEEADLRACHRASVAAAPDEDIAAELERARIGPNVVGGCRAAVFMARAAELTPDSSRRASRELAAAEAALAAGNVRGGGPLAAGPPRAHRPRPARSDETGGGGIPQLHGTGRRSPDPAGGGQGSRAARPPRGAGHVHPGAAGMPGVQSTHQRNDAPRGGRRRPGRRPALEPGGGHRRPAGLTGSPPDSRWTTARRCPPSRDVSPDCAPRAFRWPG